MTNCPIISAHGADIPAIGLGTWQLANEVCETAVATALDVGYRHIDTAAMYGNEAAVGRAIGASKMPREQIFLTTKVWHDQLAEGALQRSAEKSLKTLDQPYVDLLLIHWPNPAIPVAQYIAALCDAKRRGLARHIGICNHPVALIAEALKAATEPLVCHQFEYHPHLDQSKVLAATRAAGMALTSYCPLGRGDTGGVLAEPAVRAIAKAHGKTPAQVVLRWQLQQPGVIAIPKTATPSRIRENFACFDFALTIQEMAQLSSLARPNGRIVNPANGPKWD